MIHNLPPEEKKKIILERLKKARDELTAVTIAALSFTGHTKDYLPKEFERCVKMIHYMCEEVENMK